ncbi:flavoprotein-like protein [Bisporella sp. PMI_857]|nr:flavoprotein-like protein [Bisporella sp. PMI_857]
MAKDITKTSINCDIRAKCRLFLLDAKLEATDWTSQLELKVLVLYGRLRNGIGLAPELEIVGRFNVYSGSYSKLLAFEASRILRRLGCDCSPEQHGNITAVFKNQIGWIPLSTGSVRPTQGRTLSVIRVNGRSRSFNSANILPTAWKQFDDEGGNGSGKARLLPSGNRDRLVDCMEEFVKYTVVMRPYIELLGDRFSERKENVDKQMKDVPLKKDIVNKT